MKLSEYKNLNLKKEEVRKVTEEELNAELANLANSRKSKVVVDKESALGDIVTINFEGFVDGVAFEGGKGENYDLGLGSNSFIPGFEDQLVGYHKGDKVDVKVTFPENYHAENLKGKEALFKCEILAVKEEKVPTLDDEFAKTFGFENLEGLKEGLMSQMQSAAENEMLNKFLQEVLSYICEHSEIDYTKEELDNKIEDALGYYESQMMQLGATLDSYLQMSGMSKEDLIERITPEAETNLKIEKIVDEITRLENLTASDEEIEVQLKNLAAMHSLSEEQIADFRKNHLENFKKEITKQKTLGFLISNN